jgi:phosphoglycolate phosphatase-like HAD superfamily hydrolase
MNANRCYQHVLAWKEALDASQSGRSRRRSGSDSGRDARSGQYAKPDPDLLLAVAERLNAPIETAVVVGDSIWDMIAAVRCRALCVGLLTGGYGPDELRQSGAFRVYEDPADLLYRIDEVGSRR